MRKLASGAMIAAIFAGILGVQPAPAAHNGCDPETWLWKYCGEHLRYDKRLSFKVNHASKPSNLSANTIKDAAEEAAREWNRVWPLYRDKIGCEVVCIARDDSTLGAALNGENTILWGNPSVCGGTSDTIAIACLYYEGSSGAARHRIREVDIILNPAKAWRQPGALSEDNLTGELRGVYPIMTPSWYDLQSALTHELGHAIGLEHVGEGRRFPSDFSAVGQHTQTMYASTYPGTTNKRSLDVGDIMGSQRVALDSATDR